MTVTLAGVTIVAPDLDRVIEAYATFLGYQAGPVGVAGPALAAQWNAPDAATARVVELRPASGEARFIRLVEGQPAPDYRPLAHPGWAAAEIVVQAVDELAETLANSPFRIVGPPAVLDFDFTDKIKAMQVIGPCGEALYLTQIDGEVPGFALPQAMSAVGQLFIMVLATRSLPESMAALVELGGVGGPEIEARIEVLSDVFGLPRDHRHKLATVALTQESYVEVDQLPDGALDRPPSSIGLASGIAAVTLLRDGSTVELLL
ncbi:MAG: hypothetical protein ABW169_10175 [Sphingobium sp.]